jgi:glycerol-3-phosphate cytidylyltransferase
MFELFESLKKQKKKVGFTAGTFDFPHPGHVMMLEECRANCDFLIVGLLSDPTISRPEQKQKPLQSMYERFIQLQAIQSVNYIIPFDTEEDLLTMIKMIKPNIRFVGEEYAGQDFNGRAWCQENEVELYFNRRDHKYSSTYLRQIAALQLAGEMAKKAIVVVEDIQKMTSPYHHEVGTDEIRCSACDAPYLQWKGCPRTQCPAK